MTKSEIDESLVVDVVGVLNVHREERNVISLVITGMDSVVFLVGLVTYDFTRSHR